MTDAPERIWMDWEGPHEADHSFQFEKFSFDCVSQHEYIRADMHAAALQEAYADGINAARDAVAGAWAPITGTPYIAGPNAFCKAIDAISKTYEVKQ